jgi:DNA-binding beta-propeller fold protein YncE
VVRPRERLFPRVFRIDGATEVLSVVAGSEVGFSGDGGSAREARLQDPWRLSVDAAGNLYFSDHGNRRVRKIDVQTGVISTVAGNGQLTDFFPDRLATRTPLQFLLGTCVDGAGNLYIADAGNHRVRRVDARSGVITTVAGGGDDDPGAEPAPATRVALGRPVQLAFHGDGNLLVSDTDRHQVLVVDLGAATVRRVAGTGEAGFSGDGGPGLAARLRAPTGIAVDSAGRVLIADSGNQRLRRLEGL